MWYKLTSFFVLFAFASGQSTCPCQLVDSDTYPDTKAWDCRNLGLVEIPGQCYEIESDVSELLLSTNSISSVRNIDLVGLDQLRSLYLDSNKIVFFDETALHGIDLLENFHVDHNADLELPENVFEQNSNLKEVILVGSRIGVLPSLVNAPNLEKLDGRSCELTSMPRPLFGTLNATSFLLNIYGNSITDIAADSLLPIPEGASIIIDTATYIWAIDINQYYEVLGRNWDINVDLNTNLKACQQDGQPTDESVCEAAK